MVALFQLFAHLINLSDVVLDSKKIGFLYNHCRNKSETIIFTAVVMATVFLVLANGGTLSITCREGRGGRGGKVRMLHLSLADKHPTPTFLDKHSLNISQLMHTKSPRSGKCKSPSHVHVYP